MIVQELVEAGFVGFAAKSSLSYESGLSQLVRTDDEVASSQGWCEGQGWYSEPLQAL